MKPSQPHCNFPCSWWLLLFWHLNFFGPSKPGHSTFLSSYWEDHWISSLLQSAVLGQKWSCCPKSRSYFSYFLKTKSFNFLKRSKKIEDRRGGKLEKGRPGVFRADPLKSRTASTSRPSPWSTWVSETHNWMVKYYFQCSYFLKSGELKTKSFNFRSNGQNLLLR